MSSGSSTSASISTIVAKHYNELQEKGLDARKESRIFYMRSFNNWIKSMLINTSLKTLSAFPANGNNQNQKNRMKILDLCCGKGGDIQKWVKSGLVSHVVFADIAETSVAQCRERYGNLRFKSFTAEFVVADCTKETLSTKYNPSNKFDLVSVQFSFHYSFESLNQAEKMLENISENLAVGGLFIGTLPNANRIVKWSRLSKSRSFGNDIFQIRFESSTEEQLPLFGAKYYFQLDEVVNCPEFLVHFGAFERLALKQRLRLKYKHTFDEYFGVVMNDRCREEEGRFLLERMQALETFPRENNAQEESKSTASEYSHAEEFHKSNKFSRIGTLSKSEWETVALYEVFCFEKF